MFGSGIGAAGIGKNIARFRIETVVVPGNQLVQYRGILFNTGTVGMIVYHVKNDIHAVILLERENHLADFLDSGIRVGNGSGIGAFGNLIVPRVVAPVVGVLILHIIPKESGNLCIIGIIVSGSFCKNVINQTVIAADINGFGTLGLNAVAELLSGNGHIRSLVVKHVILIDGGNVIHRKKLNMGDTGIA